jgi:hypothetical protein
MAQIILANGTAPSNPAAGNVAIYSKTSDKQLYYRDETGLESVIPNFNSSVLSSAFPSPFRNRFINSDMSVSQVNGGAAVTPTASTWVIDQWLAVITQASKLTFQQVADAPAGLKYSTKISVAAQYAPGAAERFRFVQGIEGQNVIDMGFGTATPSTIAVSFWVKGSVAGTYTIAVKNNAYNRAYLGTYTVTTSWVRQTVVLVADNTGTWATDYTLGVEVSFDLGSGSTFLGSAGAWTATNNTGVTGATVFINQAAGSTLNITGVQVEAVPTGATTPTAYEFLPYETQLRRAQRYLPYWASFPILDTYASAGGAKYFNLMHPVPTRAPLTGFTLINTPTYANSSAFAFNAAQDTLSTRMQVTVTAAGNVIVYGASGYGTGAQL